MAGYNSHFQRGAGVYTCVICTRQTRGCPDSASLQMCEHCYELAGADNQHNDDGTVPTAEEMKEYNGYMKVIKERGGAEELVRKHNGYIFNEKTDKL